ncbi:MAG: CHAT domain-containing protein [Cyanobacteria bacterium J06635_1]
MRPVIYLPSLTLGCCAVWTASASAQIVPTQATDTNTRSLDTQIDISGGIQADGNQFHQFQQFNLDAGQVANFLSDPSVRNILSQVVGGEVSTLDGVLQVTGSQANLYIINPTGIVFGPNARLNLAGSFTATTASGLELGDQWLDSLGSNDYLVLVGEPSGFNFAGEPAVILNQGDLAVEQGQAIRLIGGAVVNEGSLSAPSGEITLLAVRQGDRVQLRTQGQVLSLEVSNQQMTAGFESLAELPAALTGGDIDHGESLVQQADGSWQIDSAAEGSVARVSGRLDVSTGGQVGRPVDGQIDGHIGGHIGGQINIAADYIELQAATFDASGIGGGGSIRVGGNLQGQSGFPQATTTRVDADSRLRADAGRVGDGGEIIVWAESSAQVQGTLTARGIGQGGFVETSGKQRLDVDGATVRADGQADGATPGTWLLDPVDIAIQQGGGGVGSLSVIDPDAIATTLDSGTNVAITTANGDGGSGDIRLNDSIDQTGGGQASLTLTGRRFEQNNGATINLSSTGELRFNLNQVAPEATPSFDSVQSAIDAVGAIAGDASINLGAGTYTSTGVPLQLDTSITLTGAGAANTLLSGDRISQVAEVLPGVTAEIQNLTVTQGVSNGDLPGGGLVNQGDLRLSNVVFSDNQALINGGALFNAGRLTATNTSFVQNQTNFDAQDFLGGGAFYNLGVATLIRNQFLENRSARDGGAIFNNGQITIRDSLFRNNFAGQDGGAFYSFQQANTEIRDTVFEANQTDPDGNGGAIQVWGNLDLINSTLSGNVAGGSGGAIVTRTGDEITLLGTTLTGNRAANNGGGLFVFDGAAVTLLNSTLAQNQSTNGGGILIEQGQVALQNTIVASNQSASASDVSGAFIDLGTNLIGIREGSSGFTVSPLVGTRANPLDPGLLPLGDYGDSTPTLGLASDSPAINAGSFFPGVGNRRIADGQIDIGASEAPPAAVLAPESLVPESLAPDLLTDLRIPMDASQANSQGSGLENWDVPILDTVIVQAIEAAFTQDHTDYYGASPMAPLPLAQIRQTLGEADRRYNIRSAIVYAFFVSTPDFSVVQSARPTAVLPRATTPRPDDRLVLIAVTGSGELIKRPVAVTRQEIVDQAKLFRTTVADPEDNQSYRPLARQLYGWLLDPLEAELAQREVDTLMFSFDQGLRTLPVAALMDNNTFLIERYVLSTIPSMTLLTPDASFQADTVAALGVDRFQSLQPLPAVPQELKVIQSEMAKSQIFLNETSTLQTLRQLSQTQPGIVHLATHAVVRAGDPTQSYLQLWDTQLTFDRLASLNWHNNIELLILSACSTAIGSAEAELGFTGLASASGARTTLGSLWEVSDVGTLALMGEFYGRLGHHVMLADVLRETQLSLLNGTVHINSGVLVTSQRKVTLPADWSLSSRVELTHPFYWSAFSLVGTPW